MDSHSSQSDKPTSHPTSKHHQANPTLLLSSAKVVAGAAQSAFRHDIGKIDRAELADAAADLLGAASHYAKLEERSFGKYVEQAENYLHQYHSSHSPHSSAAATAGTAHSSASTTAHSSHSSTATPGHSSATHPSASEAHSEGGFGDYLKLAEGFLKKY